MVVFPPLQKRKLVVYCSSTYIQFTLRTCFVWWIPLFIVITERFVTKTALAKEKQFFLPTTHNREKHKLDWRHGEFNDPVIPE